jgi:hypothetical protein
MTTERKWTIIGVLIPFFVALFGFLGARFSVLWANCLCGSISLALWIVGTFFWKWTDPDEITWKGSMKMLAVILLEITPACGLMWSLNHAVFRAETEALEWEPPAKLI